MESWVQNWRPPTLAFCDFFTPCVQEVLRLPGKIILANLKIWYSKMQLVRQSVPWLLNRSGSCISCTAPATPIASLQILFKRPTPHHFWNCCKAHTLGSLLTRCRVHCACHTKRRLKSKTGPNMRCFYHFDLEMCFAPQRHRLFRHLKFQKLVRTCGACGILTSKRASRDSGMHFFDIWTSKSAPTLRRF